MSTFLSNGENAVSGWLSSFRSIQSESNKALSRLICVTGGKGGVGKTSLALKMALELSNLGKKVLLIDCDTNLSNTGIKLGIAIKDDFFNLLTGEKSFYDCLYRKGNFHLLSACNGNLDLYDNETNLSHFIIEVVREHRSDYDYVLLDSPAGVNEYTLALAAFSDDRMFVVNPDGSSITDAYSMMKILKKRFEVKENLLIVNKSKNKAQYSKVVRTISETAENYLDVRTVVLGQVPFLGNSVNFDSEFICGQNNPAQQNTLNILKKYVDRIDDLSLLNPSQQAHSINFEHEVQSL